MTAVRGTTNRNSRGGAEERRRRREWLVETFRADVDLLVISRHDEEEIFTYNELCRRSDTEDRVALMRDLGRSVSIIPVCRCYRCGKTLTASEVQVDRIVPGCKGGTYRRNNIRPNCKACSEHAGGKLGAEQRRKKKAA